MNKRAAEHKNVCKHQMDYHSTGMSILIGCLFGFGRHADGIRRLFRRLVLLFSEHLGHLRSLNLGIYVEG